MPNIIYHPSSNFDERGSKVEFIILHYTGMKSGKEAIERLCNPASKVSAHYVIEEDGRIFNIIGHSDIAPDEAGLIVKKLLAKQ